MIPEGEDQNYLSAQCSNSLDSIKSTKPLHSNGTQINQKGKKEIEKGAAQQIFFHDIYLGL